MRTRRPTWSRIYGARAAIISSPLRVPVVYPASSLGSTAPEQPASRGVRAEVDGSCRVPDIRRPSSHRHRHRRWQGRKRRASPVSDLYGAEQPSSQSWRQRDNLRLGSTAPEQPSSRANHRRRGAVSSIQSRIYGARAAIVTLGRRRRARLTLSLGLRRPEQPSSPCNSRTQRPPGLGLGSTAPEQPSSRLTKRPRPRPLAVSDLRRPSSHRHTNPGSESRPCVLDLTAPEQPSSLQVTAQRRSGLGRVSDLTAPEQPSSHSAAMVAPSPVRAVSDLRRPSSHRHDRDLAGRVAFALSRILRRRQPSSPSSASI